MFQSDNSCVESDNDENIHGEDETDRCTTTPPNKIYPILNNEFKDRISPDYKYKYDSANESYTSLDTSSKSLVSNCSPNLKSRKPNLNSEKKSAKPIIKDTSHDYEEVLPKGRIGFMPVVYIGFVFLLMLGLFVTAYQYKNLKTQNSQPKQKNITEIYRDLRADLQILHTQLKLTRHTWVQV